MRNLDSKLAIPISNGFIFDFFGQIHLSCRRCSPPRRPSSLARSAPPHVPSSSRRLSSLARRCPPLPAAVVVAPALVPGPSASALACRQRPLACRSRCAGSRPVPCLSASALACRQRPLACCRRRAGSRPCRRAGSCLLPVSVRPRLPSLSSRRLTSLARRRPPLPAVSAPLRAVVIAPALVPCLPASALACRRRCRRSCHRWRRMRPTDHRRPAAARAFTVLSASSSLVTKLIVAL